MSRAVPAVPPVQFESTVALVGPVATKALANTVRIGSPVLGRSQWHPLGEACNWLLGGGAMQLASWGPVDQAIGDGDSYTFASYCWPRAQCRARLWQITVINSAGAVGGFATADAPGGKGFSVADNTLQVLTFTELRDSVDDTGEAIENVISMAPFSANLSIIGATLCELPIARVGNPGDGERGVELDSLRRGHPIYHADESSPSTDVQLSVNGVIKTAAVLCGNGQTPIRRAKILDWFHPDAVLTTSSSFSNIFRANPLAQARQVRGESQRSVNWAAYAVVTGGGAGEIRVTSSVDASTSTIAVSSTSLIWHTGTIAVETDDIDDDGWVRNRATLTFEHRATAGTLRTFAIAVGE